MQRLPRSSAIWRILPRARPGFQHGPVFGHPAKELKPYKKAEMRTHSGGYFIRLTVHDKVGVFASIAKHMADNAISLESIVQRNPETGDTVSAKNVILVTHETSEAAVRKALAGIEEDGILIDRAQMIRIERAG
jgi:homoserine dehydrogenase